MIKERFANKLSKYRLELRHITVLVVILIAFQVILGLFQKSSLRDFVDRTQIWYKQDSAERIANLTANSLELLVQNLELTRNSNQDSESLIVQSLNIILSQQILEQNVEEICLFINKNDKTYVIDEGSDLYKFIYDDLENIVSKDSLYSHPLQIFLKIKDDLREKEEIYTEIEEEKIFHIYVPFTPNGEYLGALYMKNVPDFNFITQEFFSSYDELAIVYSALVLLSLLTMYYISSYTLKERDLAQEKLFEEKEKLIKANVDHEKESMFTKRIYHTHHKAEKIMGFIKDDLRNLNEENIEETKQKVTKYANFISRVIYDMKWYDPPLQTIRNPMFNTNLNNVIKFVVDSIFLRISSKIDNVDFNLDLDEKIPNIKINEFVVWEILEPLIQNGIDHGEKEKIKINIRTKFFADENIIRVYIEDNGIGIKEELLQLNEKGFQTLFGEEVTTKENESQNRGYGCYIAYELAAKRCGWKVSAENIKGSGALFLIEIKV